MLKNYTFLIVFFLLFQTELHAKMYAVIVGVAEYANPKNKLTYADNDAKTFYYGTREGWDLLFTQRIKGKCGY